MRLVRRGPANGNPRYCGTCDRFLRACPGGTEVDLSLIFVDVRGSVALAERLQPADYSRHLTGFFRSATQALLDTNGFLIEFRGDSVVGVYPPGLAGPDHPRKAVAAACGFLRAVATQTHGRTAPPLGVGAHTGTVYVGTVSGAEGSIQDIGIFGDAANVAARLSQMAEPGEALISDALCTASGMPTDGLETRRIALKGRRAGSTVYVLRPQA
jgi:adenylate cyclase